METVEQTGLITGDFLFTLGETTFLMPKLRYNLIDVPGVSEIDDRGQWLIHRGAPRARPPPLWRRWKIPIWHTSHATQPKVWEHHRFGAPPRMGFSG